MTWLLQWLGLEGGEPVHQILESSWHAARPVSTWLFVLITIVGLALALMNFYPGLTMRRSVRVWTCLFRLGMLAILLAVLVGLEWHVVLSVEQRQHWTVLVDDSASMATADENGQSRYAQALADWQAISDRFGSQVELAVATFSNQPFSGSSEPGQGPTAFQQAIQRTALNQHRLDRLIVLTDGRDSETRDLSRLGEDLLARDVDLNVAVYGQTIAANDAGLTAEPDRSIIRLGEDLRIVGAVLGVEAGDRTVILKEDGKKVAEFVAREQFNHSFEARYQPEKAGDHTYTVELPVSGDPVAQNNRVSFTVSVVDQKINVLMVEGFPRFEFKLYKSVLEVDPMVNLVTVSHLPGSGVYVQGEALHRNPEQGLIESQAELFKYDVVVLRDVPRSYFREGGDTSESRLQHIVEFVVKRGGGLMVTGGQDVYRAGGYETSHLAGILPFDLSDAVSSKPQFEGMFYVGTPDAAYDHPVLRLLPDPGENRARLNGLPQLDGSNNVGQFKPMATPLLTRIVTVDGPSNTQVERMTPIMGTMPVGEGRVIAVASDTLWRWQLQADYEDPPLTALLANAVRYLAPPPAQAPGAPSVGMADAAPQVGQDLKLASDLRDKNYDPIINAELMVTVKRPDGSVERMLPRDLPEEPGHYAYRVHLDQPGPYEVTAEHGEFKNTRRFLAGAAAGEFADLSADRDAMAQFASAAEGELISSPVSQWVDQVDLKPALSTVERDLEVWNSPLLLLLFIALVSADTFVRKRQGLA